MAELWILLLAVIACLGRVRIELAYICTLAAVCMAVLHHFVYFSGVAALLILFIWGQGYIQWKNRNPMTPVYWPPYTHKPYKLTNIDSKLISLWIALLVAGLVGGLILHMIPGFSNVRAFDRIVFSPLSSPYTMYHNFDKILAALVLFVALRLDMNEQTINMQKLKKTLFVLTGCIVTILGPALLSGYVKIDIKWPTEIGIWAFNNLFFVCFSEEVIFRGVLQKELTRAMENKKWGWIVSIILASIVFGASHIKSGGPVYMALATLCGLFYGYAYHITQSIRCSMLVHFGLNLTHFVFFTYPSAAILRP